MNLTTGDHARIAAAVEAAQRVGERRRTAWWLLTGPPGSGKTTLAGRFEMRGWRVCADPARAEFDAQALAGVSPEAQRQDYLDFQRRVLHRSLRTINAIPNDECVVFDYGIAEALAFMRVAGLAWDNEIVRAAAALQFEKVFVLDLLPPHLMKMDAIRAESAATRMRLLALIDELYVAFGHQPVRVPLLSPQERLKWILGNA